MVDLGFQDPKTIWNAYKTREKRHNTTTGLATGLASNWSKKYYKTGEKRQKDKWYLIRAPPKGPPTLLFV